MPEKIRVFEAETKHGKAPNLQVQHKGEEPASDGVLTPVRLEVPLTRDLILRLIELIKQV